MRFLSAALFAAFLPACAGQLAGDKLDPDEGVDLVAGLYGGDCEDPFPDVEREDWRHRFLSPLTTSQGDPNHRVRDLILAEGERSLLRAHFTYGVVDKDLEDEDVEVFFQRCPGWESWGVYRTDSDGVIYVEVPGDLPAGDYRVRLVVKGDGSTADGIIAVWRPGVQAVITDVDGTLTTSDFQVLSDLVLGEDARMYEGADEVMRAWVDKGYRVVYLTGRPQYINRYTREWLSAHGLPKGPLQLTEEAGDVLPSDAGVRAFKAAFLLEQREFVGVEWTVAYGNATTDIGAYADAGIPREDTYIIGPHAGEQETQAVSSYPENLPLLPSYPDAVQP
jgi:hypothetical protein